MLRVRSRFEFKFGHAFLPYTLYNEWAGVFYNVKNGSSFIVSKSSSKFLSNENKHAHVPRELAFWFTFCLEDKKTAVFVFITEMLWRTFWHNNWRSVFEVVKRLRSWQLLSYFAQPMSQKDFSVLFEYSSIL